MSRRAGTDRAAENQQTIKNLLKLESNKICADCKKNKHPRWASWNIGVFVCIRCSGIHRGMGTHISRVKSVDLDAWTDEQLQSVLRWGNSRANKYWEAKLAAGHMPSETKIENFIRTKYESKRWVMDGPMPDPSTLDAEGDDDVPLSIVQEKAKIERSSSERQQSAQDQPLSQRRTPPTIDLFGDDHLSPTARASSTDTATARQQPKSAAPVAQRQTNQGDSLLGLDFFGHASSSGPPRPSSASSSSFSTGGQSRPDLKQSILSLYSSAPKPQASSSPNNQQSTSGAPTFPVTVKSQDTFGKLTDDFSGLNFPTSNPRTSSPPPPLPQPKPSSSQSGVVPASVNRKSTPSAPQVSSPPPLSGGSFFDSLSTKKPTQPNPQAPPQKTPNGLDFATVGTSTAMSTSDILAPQGFLPGQNPARADSPALPPVPPPTMVSSPAPASNLNSAFNLSARPAAPAIPAAGSKPPLVSQSSAALFDPWSSANENNAWSTPDTAPALSRPSVPSVDIGRPPAHITPKDVSGGWGETISSSQRAGQNPSVAADEEYGGWTSAPTNETPVSAPTRSNGGFSGASDPFDNPWG